jgi:transposase
MNNIKNLVGHYDQLLGLTEPWFVSNVELDTEKLSLRIEVSTHSGTKLPCPKCSKPCSKEDHRQQRVWRHLDTMQFETLIVCTTPRINCPEHGILTVDVPWAGSYSRFTQLFEKFAIDVLVAAKSIKVATELLRLSWDQIHEIQKRAVERGLTRRLSEKIKHVGIDEKSFLNGHSYASVLYDLDKGRVLEIEPERTEIAATKLLNTLTDKQKQEVEAIAMDMWPAFKNAANTVIPKAEIVHDKYHITTYLSKAVDLVRRKENSSLLKQGDDTLKGTKYLWLTNVENMKQETKKTFSLMAKDELKVGRAWSIKETFKHFWDYSYIGAAQRFFKSWYYWATHSKLKPIIEAARTIKRHLVGIMAYLKHHITNAVAEGLNSKIQLLKANARGFRNFQNYRIAILFHCGKLELYP